MISPISREDYQRVKELLAAALEIASSERTGFLQSQCDGNFRLQAEVESLLAVSENAGKFLESYSAVSIIQNSVDEGDNFIDRKINDYRIVREIGRGGMGVVFLATREDFHQQTAIKLIKRGMDSDAILERFAREREILAALNHAFIARLLDGGTTVDGRPFFVMEHVEGVSIDEHCKTNNLSEKEILELFRKVCEAVQFAHQKLIVHRDLKPSNILVTADGTPKLLDFGIAKLLTSDESQNTQTNQRAFTPAYASPEQISGEQVDTTSDVYSLGKILAELLQANGKSAGKKTNASEGNITNNLPSSLSTDLQAILQTALRDERDRRYNSVERFADDIRRYQSGLPVTARKDTFTYRAKKFVQRNAIAVSAAALFLIVSIIGLTIIIREHNKAERRFNDVRMLANSFLFEFDESIQDLAGATPARKLVVQRALEYLSKLDQESAGDASLERELATAYQKIGQIQGNTYYSNLGDTEGAMKSYARSLEIRQKLASADPNNADLQRELSESFEGVGDMTYTVEDLKGALKNYQNALAIREKIASANPANQKYQSMLADIYSKVGDISGLDGYPNLGDTAASLENYQKASAINARLIDADPDNFDYKMHYAQRLTNLGSLYRVLGKTSDSISALRKSDEIYQSLAATNPNDFTNKFNMLVNNATLRYALVDDEHYEDAVSLMNRTIKMLQEMQATDPQNAIVRRSLGVSYNALSRTLVAKGDFDGALENSGKALKIAEDAAGKDAASGENSADLAATLQFLGDVQLSRKNYSEALASYKQATEIYRKNLASDPSNARTKDNLANCLAGIGKTIAATGNFDEAIKDFAEVLSIAEEAAQKSPVNVILRSHLALRYMELGELYQAFAKEKSNQSQNAQAEAQKWFGKSADIWSKMQSEETLNKADGRLLEKLK